MALDLDNYLDRITELQQTITTNAHASKVAGYTQSDYPYWTNLVTTPVAVERFAHNEWRYDISVVMRLHRGNALEGEDTQLELVCIQDIADTYNAFLTNKLLTTATYTAPQAGYAPHTLNLQSQGVVVIPTASEAGDLGTVYTLTFSHYEYEG